MNCDARSQPPKSARVRDARLVLEALSKAGEVARRKRDLWRGVLATNPGPTTNGAQGPSGA